MPNFARLLYNKLQKAKISFKNDYQRNTRRNY